MPDRGRSFATLPRRLVASVLIGIGTIVGAKSDREQHWSIPPTMVDAADQAAASDGDGRDDGDDGDDVVLPACA